MNYIEKIQQNYSKELIEDLYCNQLLSIKKIMQQLNITKTALLHLIDIYNLTRDKHAVKSKSNTEVKNRYYNNVKKRISKEDLENYYIEEDNSYYDTIKYFQISEWVFDKLLKDYNIKKDRSKSFGKGKQKRIELYGFDNLTNWKKGQKTRINNSGSLEESYRRGYEKQIQTMLDRYNVKCSFLKDDVNGKKKHSQPNEQFARLLDLKGIKYEREFILDNKSYDFKVDNKLIEINPLITHNVNFNPFNKEHNYEGLNKNYHLNKSKLAKENGYQCIHVWQWDDLDKIIKLLQNREIIYGRKCAVKEVPLKEAKNFINTYHIQEYHSARVKIGLYYNNELVSIMTFGKPRFNKNYEWELIRYCSSKNIIGGANKLFKYFISKYKPSSIISYCDNSKFSGQVYSDLKFILINKGVATRHWCNLKGEHYLDSTIRIKGFSRIIHHCSAKEDNLDTNDNYILMRRENFLEVFDCGQSTYVWKN